LWLLLEIASVAAAAQSGFRNSMSYSNSCRQRRCLELIAAAVTALIAVTASAQAPAGTAMPPGHPQKAAATRAPRIDINSAGAAELKTLPGVGDAEAKKIIAGRPWLTKIDLVTKGVLAEGVYVAIKDRVVALQPTPPVSRK
jgi:DNA uptake protein ComE-like DNA-binding protein